MGFSNHSTQLKNILLLEKNAHFCFLLSESTGEVQWLSKSLVSPSEKQVSDGILSKSQVLGICR